MQPYLVKPGVIGIYVVGSATRSYRDELSDYDIEVIVEDDVYARMPMNERQMFSFKTGDPKVVDYEFYRIPWSDFVTFPTASHDMFHHAAQHAVILHDPDGRIELIIKQLADLPEGIRLERMTVHFLEFLYRLGLNRKTTQRGDLPINRALLQGDALNSLIKLMFLAKQSLASTKHWFEQKLAELDISDTLLDLVKEWIEDPASEKARALAGAVHAFLDDAGEIFHHDIEAFSFHWEGQS